MCIRLPQIAVESSRIYYYYFVVVTTPDDGSESSYLATQAESQTCSCVSHRVTHRERARTSLPHTSPVVPPVPPLSPIEGMRNCCARSTQCSFWKYGARVSMFGYQMSGKSRAVGGGEIPSPLDGDASESSESSIQDASEDTSSSSDSAGELVETVGKKVARQRVCKTTRTRYESCLRQLGTWAKREGLSLTSRLVPPLEQSLVERYFDLLDKKRVKWYGHSNPQQTKRLSPGAIRSVCSGVYHLYRMHNLSVCERLKIFFNNFNRYHVLNVARDRGNIPPLYPVSGSSQPLSTEAYQLLCLRSWQYTPSTASGNASGRNWDNCRCVLQQ